MGFFKDDINKGASPVPYVMYSDDERIFTPSSQIYFSFQFVWADLDQTDGSVKVQISNDGVNYVDHPADSLLFNSTAGVGFIRDLTVGVLDNYLKIVISHGTCTSGTVTITGNTGRKK